MRAWLAASLAAALVGLAACSADPGAPAGSAAADNMNEVDVTFMRQTALGGQAEVTFGELAAAQGRNDRVVAFARRMVREHSAANEDLAAVAAEKGVLLSEEIDAEAQRKYARLQELDGAAFDRAYIQGQIRDHQRTVELLEHEIGEGRDAAVRAFARQRLPITLDHLQAAEDIAAVLTAGASR